MITITIPSITLGNFLNDDERHKSYLEDKYKVFIKQKK